MATTYTEHLQIPKHDPTDPFNIALINEGFDKTEAGILAAYRGRAAYNLLDNSYFLRPINQRGKTSYTGTGYGIDRWRTNFSGDTVEVLAGGVTNTVASTTGGWHLHQIIDNGAELVGKSITAACNAAAITGALYLLISCRNSSDTEIEHASQKIAAGLNVTSLTVPSGTVYIRVGVYAYATSVTVGDNVTLKWVSLYEGEYTAETLPPYMPKGYAAELAECMRYFYILKASGAAGYNTLMNGMITDSGKSLIVALETGTKMRLTAPTISFSGTVTVRGVSGYSSDATYSAPYENPVFTVRSSDGGRMGIEIKKTDGTAWADLTNNTPICVTFNSGSVLTMTADL